MAPRPSIYVDTNVLSMLHYSGSHVRAQFQHIATLEWWKAERTNFILYALRLTEIELRQGTYRGQSRAIAACRRLPYLAVSAAVRRGIHVYLEGGIVPENKPGDAAQLALASVHEIDYLLTWNYAHLANPQTQRKLLAVNKSQGWSTPDLVSPETIPKARLGQPLRRNKS